MRRLDHWLFMVVAIVLAASVHLNEAHGQAFSTGGGRPFVTGFTPVIGPGGGVGGVDVDANGVLNRVQTPSGKRLDEARRRASRGVSQELQRSTPMRKVSLRRLQAEIEKHASRQQPLTSDLLLLAGLQRIEYVFAYPEHSDIVVAGPAEGWVLRRGDIVGVNSGNAVLRLEDLIDALQAAGADDRGEGITCSIDPTVEGTRRLQRMLRNSKLQIREADLRVIEKQVGDHLVTVTGVRSNSHFARVMVAADYLMKRIAMELEPSPVAGLPSYMRLLTRRSEATQLSSPRWWLAPDYERVEKSTDALAWRFQGRGVQARSEHAYRDSRGELVNSGRPSRSGKLWAEEFTNAYDQLGKQLHVFSQLRGCVDLAVVANLIVNEAMPDRADCPLPTLLDPSKLKGQDYEIPTSVPSQASLVRGQGRVVVSVSGGVDLNMDEILENAITNPDLSRIRNAAAGEAQTWWWD